MKQFLSLAVIFTSLLASADVVKPTNTSERAAGKSVIDGVDFEYHVLDGGWAASGSINKGNFHLTASKAFLITYQSQNQSHDQSIEKSLVADVDSKCLELGNLEFPGQVDGYPSYMKKTLKTRISNQHVTLQNEVTYARFVCRVDISIDEN